MTPETLRAIGRALFGRFYIVQLAEELDVSERTVRRWLAGQFRIPKGLDDSLGAILKLHNEELERVYYLLNISSAGATSPIR